MKKNLMNLIPAFISVFFMISAVVLSMIFPSSKPSKYETSKTNISTPKTTVKAIETAVIKENTDEEMRAVWIPYMSLNMSGTDRSEKAFQKRIDDILENCTKNKLNTIIIHIRPNGDSLYPSKYFPWSDIISGTQGKNPSYNPLKYIIIASHKKNIKVHAWINPLRIRFSQTPSALSSDNPYTIWQNDDNEENNRYTFQSGKNIYYNPAYSEVRELIINGVREIIENYEVDGIHFDDYFYPEDDMKCDEVDYKKYLSTVDENYSPLSHTEWRKANINALISGVYTAIHEIKDNAVFGISPQCNTENDEKISADIKSWGSIAGFVDYICPQIYVSNTHPYLPFKKSADEWRKIINNKSVKFYIGLAVYKAGSDSDGGTWLESDEILKNQILYGRSINCDGFMLYSYEYLSIDQTSNEVKNAIAMFNN